MPSARRSAHDAFAIAAPGLAPLVAAELSALGITPQTVSDAGVAFAASPDDLFRVNLWSRIATRVLVRLGTFAARDFATLEKQAAKLPWQTIVAPGTTVRLRVTCRKSRLYHSDAVAERVARGILRAVPSAVIRDAGRATDDEPAVDAHAAAVADDRVHEANTDAPDTGQLMVVRLERDQCTISADSSGALLHRRGWRLAVAKAPLRETLAAAMLAACEWNGTIPLVDPFGGSGTIAIEAALRARGMAPGLTRPFAMEQWPDADAARTATHREMARAAARPSAGVRIACSDRDAGACAAARANAERAGVAADMDIVQHALSDVDLSALGPTGLMLSNPPYGQRVSDGADLRNLYARLGDVLRAGGPGWSVGLLVPDRRLVSPAHLPFTRILQTTNGGIRVGLEVASLAPRRDHTRK